MGGAEVEPADSSASSGYVIVGRIRRAHGIRGELVVEPLTDSPASVFAVGKRLIAGNSSGDPFAGKGPAELHVSGTRPFGDKLLVFVDEIPDRSAAELWRGRYLLLPAGEIAQPVDGEVFIHELTGMRVVEAGEAGTIREHGTVGGNYELPQGLMLEVIKPGGGTALLPFRGEMVMRVDRQTRTIFVRVPEGLFDL